MAIATQPIEPNMQSNKRERKSKRPPRQLQRTFEEVEKKFFDAMRRPMCADDRAFYWSYCYSAPEFKRQMMRLLIQANVPEHLIYVYDKTGFMVNTHGYKRLSKEERSEIRAANLEYHALEEEGIKDHYKLADFDDFPSAEDDPLVQALYVLGNFIERNINSGRHLVDSQRFICGYLLVRAFRIVRAIFRSQNYTTTEESLVLVRSLYEIYCKLCYACKSKTNARYLMDSDFGLATGHYKIFQKDGKSKRHLLIHKKSGKIIPRTRSFYEYISSSPFNEDIELFEALYEYLSSFVHSGSRHALRAWERKQGGFSLTDDDDEGLKVFVLLLTSFVSAMIMQATLRLRNVSSVSRWDISLFCYAMHMIVSEVGSPPESGVLEIVSKIKARAALLPKKPTAFKPE